MALRYCSFSSQVFLSGNYLVQDFDSYQVRVRNKQHLRAWCTKAVSKKPTAIETTDAQRDVQIAKKKLDRPQLSWPAAICNAIEDFIVVFEPSVYPPLSDPKLNIAGNWAPVEECPPVQCVEVKGKIPACLDGVYVRNGTNPRFLPNAGYHLFDGDGMLHAVRIKDGAASYCCRYVKTSRFQQEEKWGQKIFPNSVAELHGLQGLAKLALFALRVALRLITIKDGYGTANASLVFSEGRLLALVESDLPYAIKVTEDGDLETLGRYNLVGGEIPSLSSHPKVDPATNETFWYGYKFFTKPFLNYLKVSEDRVKGRVTPINSWSRPYMMHDFAITKRHIIFPETQVTYDLKEMLKGRSLLKVDKKIVPRWGILPRSDSNNDSQIRWFDVPDMTCMHFPNAWEQGDEIVVLGCKVDPVELMLEDMAKVKSRLHRIHLNMKTGKANIEQVSSIDSEMPQINNNFTGKMNRYIYMVTDGPWPKFGGLVKIDLQAKRQSISPCNNPTTDNTFISDEQCIAGWKSFGDDCYGSEACFIPRDITDGNLRSTEEDDGYLMCYVHNERTGVTELQVIDASSPSLETVASIKLPSRVPYGIHGIFLNALQLSQQNPIPVEVANAALNPQSGFLSTIL
ncbi:hypothetical protein O6H91_01G002800 [Diphasiastrum complanatum]|uniref:Uncharacterized protein n=1 Tax=Diphasiastrum complanatum TaxID=34168 RepID=A0ACC2EMM9_DIPCM|nr:hypothetical protein O6H91_01G002800 [Diphasiastrum complanatum]